MSQRVQEQANVGATAVTTTAQQVMPFRRSRTSVSLRNAGATTLYIGASTAVTTANGYPLLPDEEYEFTDYVGALSVICGSTGDLRYFEVY
jgi:hypothetical protein